VLAWFGLGDEHGEALHGGYSFPVGTQSFYIYFVGFAEFNWAIEVSAALVLGVSWSTFSGTNKSSILTQ